MNQAINVFTFPLLLIYCVMMAVVSYDLSISTFSLRAMPYQPQIFTGFALVILLLGLIRIRRRWQGIRDMKKFSQFTFKAPLAKPSIQYAKLFTLVEAVFLGSVLIFSTTLLDLNMSHALPMIIVLSLLILEMFIFVFMAKEKAKPFHLGMNDRVIAYFNREMHLYFYTGLKKVELHSKDLINFVYKEGLSLTLPTDIINNEDRIAFRDALIEVLENKNVYIDDALRNWE